MSGGLLAAVKQKSGNAAMAAKPKFRFETIVVAADFSDSSSSALRYAEAISKVHGARMIVAHAIDPVCYAYSHGEPDAIRRDKAAHAEVTRIEADTRHNGTLIHAANDCGIICNRILQCVHDNRADLLVMGTRATTLAGRTALGIIARKLLARTPCPMLLASPECEAHLLSAGVWRKVLAATDFSIASLEALGFAHRVAYERLMVVHAEPCTESSGSKNCLERLRFLAPFNESHTVPIEHLVITGDPGKVIADHANKFQADLVILGSPVDELDEEDFCTSTVLQVVSRVDCPVLCVPSTLASALNPLMRDAANVC